MKSMLIKLKIFLFITLFFGCIGEKKIEWKGYYEAINNVSKPILLYFCSNNEVCRKMDKVFENKEVIEKAKNFVMIKVDVEKEKWLIDEYRLKFIPYLPTIIFLDSNKTELFRIVGYVSVDKLLNKMNDAINGKMGEDFSFKTIDGKIENLSDYRGKIIIVDFMATWCQPCHLQMKELEKILENYDINIISLDVDAKDDVDKIRNTFSKYVNKWKFGIDIYGIAKNYLLENAIPTLAIFDKFGRLAYLKAGCTKAEELASIIDELN